MDQSWPVSCAWWQELPFPSSLSMDGWVKITLEQMLI